MQLRTLMMDELPAIIHRLSLTLWCPEHSAKENEEAKKPEEEEVVVDPFGSPPQDAVDARGNVLDASEISSMSLDGGSEIHSLFSQKNLLRLATLTDSQRTLSLFTPSIRDAVFRAWAGPSERSDSAGSSTPATPSLMRSHSSIGSTSTTYTFSRSDDGHGHIPSRPSLVSMHSATTGLSLGAGRSRSQLHKKKTRVVNLRRTKTSDDLTSESGDSETASVVASEPIIPTKIEEEPEDNIITPPNSPSQRVRFRTGSIDLGDTPRKLRLSTSERPALQLSSPPPEQAIVEPPTEERTVPIRAQRPTYFAGFPQEKFSTTYTPAPVFSDTSSTAGSIIEQAWVMKMASEIARRAQDEKSTSQGFWSQNEREDTPPPAYAPNAN